MATGTAPPDVETFADVLHRLGDIPPERVLAKPYPATEVDVLRLMEAPRKRLCELIDGVLVEKAVGYNESDLAGVILDYLRAWVLPRNLGIVTGTDGAVRLWSGRLRIPDVAFTSWDRLPGRRRPVEPIPDLVPDLAVEVLSQSNTPAETEQKRQDYFRAGVRLVWEIDPDRRTVAVYTAADQGTTLTAADTLDGGDVLPGFALPLDRHG